MNFPLTTYNYKVRIGSKTLSFSEVSGLSVQHDEVVYRDGFSFLLGYTITRGFAKPINVTLKNGIIAEGKDSPENLRNGLTKAFFDMDKKDLFVDLCDDAGKVLVTWKVIGAVPMKLNLPDLDANGNNVAIESMEFVGRELQIS